MSNINNDKISSLKKDLIAQKDELHKSKQEILSRDATIKELQYKLTAIEAKAVEPTTAATNVIKDLESQVSLNNL